MRRERVRRDLQKTGQIAGRKAIRLVLDQCLERFQPSRLRERSQSQNSFFYFHNSRIEEILPPVNPVHADILHHYISKILEISFDSVPRLKHLRFDEDR